MTPLVVPLTVVAALTEVSPLRQGLRDGHAHFIRARTIPTLGQIPVEGTSAFDLELALLGLKDQGADVGQLILHHWALIDAYNVAQAMGWRADNPALEVRPM